MSTMSLSIVLNANLHYIPPMLVGRIADSILITESNANEQGVIEHLRTLILSFSNPHISPMQSINEYLNAPETQFSATRELFEQLNAEVNDYVNEEVNGLNADADEVNGEVNGEVDEVNEVDENGDDDDDDDDEPDNDENNWNVPEIHQEPEEIDDNVQQERQERQERQNQMFNDVRDFLNRFR